jgi:hypothetical protein
MLFGPSTSAFNINEVPADTPIVNDVQIKPESLSEEQLLFYSSDSHVDNSAV